MESTMGIMLAHSSYPSSKLCSDCSLRNDQLALGERTWICVGCGAHHDREVNAVVNLQRLATGGHAARTALPVASQAVTPGAAAGYGPAGGGKVTPVRHEHGQQDGSGQEEIGEHLCAPSR
ncbi:MAG: transposase [Massilia sp.]|nr:transposase [Massilia sp.]